MRSLAGLGRLIRLVVRLDRVRLPAWIVGLLVFIVASAASLPGLYPDQESIDDYARLFGDNPALVAFAGPGYGFDDPNIGVILVNEVQLFACIGVALMSIFLVNRHTRAEEDAERVDLLRSSTVGRHAPATAAVAVVTGANVVVAAVCALAFVALGYGTVGSVAIAVSFLLCGLAFTGVALVCAELAGGSRSSLGLASAALGLAFGLRAVGDIGDNALRWLSPIGWAQGIRAYAGEQWWPVAVAVGFSVAMVALAWWLSIRRDLGSGLLAQRPGPSRGGPWLSGPVGLAVRLQRGSVVGWALGILVLGVVYGSIGQDVEEMIAENPDYADFLAQAEGADLTESYFATAMGMLALLAAGFAISSALRLRSEENAGRAEPVLAAPVSRWHWAASHLLVSLAGSVVMMVSAGIGTGVTFAIVSSDADQVLRLVWAALVTVPGVLVLAGIATALFGLAPRLALVAWVALGFSVGIDLFGALLQLPTWTQQLSPFEHVPGVPAEAFSSVPLLVLASLAVSFAAVGVRALEGRDLRSG